MAVNNTRTRRFDLPTVDNRPEETLKLIKAPDNLSKERRTTILACLISTLRTPPVTQLATVELCANIFGIAFPQIHTMLASSTSLIVSVLTPSEDNLLRWTGLDSSKEQMADLPEHNDEVIRAARAVTSADAVNAALSSILFAIGKQAGDSAREALVENRPKALISRFQLSEDDQVLLPGRPAGVTAEALGAVFMSMSAYTEPRAAIIKFFLAHTVAPGYPTRQVEILLTNFSLLRGSGMTHLDAILRLVRMHPWTLRVPELEPYYTRFVEELEKFKQIDAVSRPYHRLLVPQAEYLFVSSEYRPLIAVAGEFIQEVESTFGNYVYNKSAYTTLINKVKSRAPNYNPSRALNSLAERLGVPDEALPPSTATDALADANPSNRYV